MVQFYWTMFSVLVVNPDCGTVRILALGFTIVIIMKMPVSNVTVRHGSLYIIMKCVSGTTIVVTI